MTMLVAITTPEGIAMSADSRAMAPLPRRDPSDRVTGFVDSEYLIVTDSLEKLVTLGDRMVCALTGRHSDGAQRVVDRMVALAPTVPLDDPASMAETLCHGLNRWDDSRDAQRANFLLAGYDQAGQPCVFSMIPSPEDPARWILAEPGGSRFRINILGDCDVSRRLLTDQPYALDRMTLQDAVTLSRTLIWIESTMRPFEWRRPSVGGPIDTLVIRPGRGVEWVARKTLTASEPGPPRVAVRA